MRRANLPSSPQPRKRSQKLIKAFSLNSVSGRAAQCSQGGLCLSYSVEELKRVELVTLVSESSLGIFAHRLMRQQPITGGGRLVAALRNLGTISPLFQQLERRLEVVHVEPGPAKERASA